MSFYEEAEAKIENGKKEKLDQYGEVMKKGVATALLEFCRQDDEFAQAVAQGGSFRDCMAAVSKAVKGNAISDMEAYGAAVKFYFPGKCIKVQMTICDEYDLEPEDKEKKTDSVIIDLSAFF